MSAETMPAVSPQQRLARNRQAMLAEVRGGARRVPARSAASGEDSQDAGAARPTGADGDADPSGFSMIRRGIGAWWQAHPARIAAHVAEPALRELAREQPLKLVGIAAGVGAAAALLRPWRLVSLGAVLAIALRPVNWSSLILGMIAGDPAPPPPDSEGRRP